jgi:hypothetical protein
MEKYEKKYVVYQFKAQDNRNRAWISARNPNSGEYVKLFGDLGIINGDSVKQLCLMLNVDFNGNFEIVDDSEIFVNFTNEND